MKKTSLQSMIKKLTIIVFSREFITYGVAGVLTTVVNYSSYHFLCNILGIQNLIANAIAWVIAVSFAYVVNAKFVFLSRHDSVKGEALKVTKFFGARVLTFVVEEIGMLIFVDLLDYHNLMVKAVLSIIVIILNYILSKIYIFRS